MPGSQWIRVFIFVVTLTFVTFVYQFYVTQNSNFIDYSDVGFLVKNYNDSDVSEEKIKDSYIVWSKACRIPNITAFHDSIKKIVSRKWKPVNCPGSENRAITELVRNKTSGITSIRLVESALRDYPVSKKQLECCYQVITRKHWKSIRDKKDDDRYQLTQPVCFKQHTELANNVEYVYVYCRSSKKRSSNKFYQTLHSVVVEKPPRQPTKLNETTSAGRYSVLIFGIDSISRLNLQRKMPETKAFLEKHDWTWLEGYNKIAENTFPNLMAILTGMTVEQITNVCYENNYKKLDDCPFLWRNYSRQGYVTAYVEDETDIGTFNFDKYGFLNAPTDYYTRPYMMAGIKLLKTKKDGGMDYCMGARPQAEYLFDYAAEYVERLQQRLHFSLFWFNSFSHNEVNQPSVMDGRVRQLLEQMQPHFNSTIVFFLSDHGARFGPIRETFVGWLEERLPYFYIWIPPAFRNEYPSKYLNLLANKNRLTSPFDVHSTLQDILYGQTVEPPAACPTCYSLFRKASWNRTCEEAAIASHWCTCSTADEQSASLAEPVVSNAAHSVLKTVNQFIQQSQKNSLKAGFSCAVLTLNKMISVRTRPKHTLFRDITEYVLVMQTNPSDALFEVTWKADGSPFKLDDVSRINMYGTQSSCVTGNSDLKKYCFCVKKR